MIALRTWRIVFEILINTQVFKPSSSAFSVKGVGICKRKNHCLNSNVKYLICLIIFTAFMIKVNARSLQSSFHSALWALYEKWTAEAFFPFQILVMEEVVLILWLILGKRKLIFQQENRTYWEPIRKCIGWHCHNFDLALHTITSASKGTIEQILGNDIELQPILFAFTAPSWIAKNNCSQFLN